MEHSDRDAPDTGFETGSLARRWPGFLERHGQVRDRLLEAYGDQDRGYHDLRHLGEVLEHLDTLLPADYPHRDEVVLAAWFHDAVYEGQRSGGESDEERSAIMAERELATIGAPATMVDEVARLVRVTADHTPAHDDLSGQLLCDADLAILAAPPGRYADYVAGVRREHADVSDADFAAGRAEVLEALLAKPTLFHSTTAVERWERDARANVEAEVHDLRGLDGLHDSA